MSVKCFFVEPTDRCRRSLRRYHHSSDESQRCPAGMGYHNASTPLDVVSRPFDPAQKVWVAIADPNIPRDDPRWPRKCDHCDYLFVEADAWQIFDRQIYADKASGAEYTLDDRSPGMMWDAFWMGEWCQGPDGRSLVVVCPNGREWMIDGPASNCTMPDDREHRCWTRTGTPPLISVGKQYGKTCGAGGGSIQAGDYHGFLGINGAAPGFFT